MRMALGPAILLVLGGCGTAPDNQTTKVAPTASKIPEGITNPWPASDHAALVERIGRPAFDRAVGLFDRAAWRIAENPACDQVANVAVDDKSASDIVILAASCRNGLREKYLETQLRQVG